MANIGEVVTILAKSIPFRREFNLAMKKSKETPNEWLARVKTLAALCGFGQCQNHCILDKFLTGFDTETINHLCSSAVHLDIATALEITEAYSMRNEKCGDDTETIFMHEEKVEVMDQKACKFVDQTKPAILVVKCEDILNDGENDECQGENDYFNDVNDNTFDDDAGSNSSSDDDNDDNNKDSDFHLSDYEKDGSKKYKKKTAKSPTDQLETTKVKRKYVKRAKGETQKKNGKTKNGVKTEKSDDTTQQDVKTEAGDATADSNASKKKRNYKQRARKVKETFECDICQYKVQHKCHLARHMLIHLNQKSLICHQCGKGFNIFSNLNAHLRRHAGYKPHVCEVCKASFIDRTRLRLHMRTHTGERPFGCTICDKRFSDRYYMKIHMRLHTGEKPFKCDQCLRTFSQSSSLSLHKRKSCLLYC